MRGEGHWAEIIRDSDSKVVQFQEYPAHPWTRDPDLEQFKTEAAHPLDSGGSRREQWIAATSKVLAGAALALACLLPGHASARESQTQAFLTPPSGYELYLAFEDRSSLAFNASTGEWIAFDPDAPAGAAHGWHQSPWLGRTSAR